VQTQAKVLSNGYWPPSAQLALQVVSSASRTGQSSCALNPSGTPTSSLASRSAVSVALVADGAIRYESGAGGLLAIGPFASSAERNPSFFSRGKFLVRTNGSCSAPSGGWSITSNCGPAADAAATETFASSSVAEGDVSATGSKGKLVETTILPRTSSPKTMRTAQAAASQMPTAHSYEPTHRGTSVDGAVTMNNLPTGGSQFASRSAIAMLHGAAGPQTLGEAQALLAKRDGQLAHLTAEVVARAEETAQLRRQASQSEKRIAHLEALLAASQPVLEAAAKFGSRSEDAQKDDQADCSHSGKSSRTRPPINEVKEKATASETTGQTLEIQGLREEISVLRQQVQRGTAIRPAMHHSAAQAESVQKEASEAEIFRRRTEVGSHRIAQLEAEVSQLQVAMAASSFTTSGHPSARVVGVATSVCCDQISEPARIGRASLTDGVEERQEDICNGRYFAAQSPSPLVAELRGGTVRKASIDVNEHQFEDRHEPSVGSRSETNSNAETQCDSPGREIDSHSAAGLAGIDIDRLLNRTAALLGDWKHRPPRQCVVATVSENSESSFGTTSFKLGNPSALVG